MCNECWKEFCGWCRAFTRLERALTLLEAVLLVLCVAAIAFFTLHMLVCSDPLTYTKPSIISTEDSGQPTTYSTIPVTTPSSYTPSSYPPSSYPPSAYPSSSYPPSSYPSSSYPPSSYPPSSYPSSLHTTLDPQIECTWVPSAKTKANIHYYATKDERRFTPLEPTEVQLKLEVDVSDSDTDGEEVEDEWKSNVIALVKMRPPNDITFGCILTIIGEFWAVTAASCIEAIEELDSLDSFVMMEDYGGETNGGVHAISDLRVHPYYRETNKSYDVAALRSQDSLTRGAKRPVARVDRLDYALSTIGERLHLLGYGAFRSMESGARGRRLRAAHVYRVPLQRCARGAGSLRHLAAGRAADGAAPAPGALCGAARGARGLPCNYCGGAPLLAGRRALLAVMRDNPACGVTCEPQLYTPVTLVADWMDDLLYQ